MHKPITSLITDACRAAKRAEQETKLEQEQRAREELEATRTPERLSSAAQDAMRTFKVGHIKLTPCCT